MPCLLSKRTVVSLSKKRNLTYTIKHIKTEIEMMNHGKERKLMAKISANVVSTCIIHNSNLYEL